MRAKKNSSSTFTPGTGPVSPELIHRRCDEFAALALQPGTYTIAEVAHELKMSAAEAYCTVAVSLIRESQWAKRMTALGVRYERIKGDGYIVVQP